MRPSRTTLLSCTCHLDAVVERPCQPAVHSTTVSSAIFCEAFGKLLVLLFQHLEVLSTPEWLLCIV